MRFSIAASVFEKFPEYCVAGVIAANVNNAAENPAAVELLQAAMVEARAKFDEANPLASHPYIVAWREAMRQAGIKPSEFLTSVEAMLKRVTKGNDLPSVNPAVDISNALSIKYVLPLGGHDIDRLVGDFEVRHSRADDLFAPPDGTDGQAETVPEGEIVYVDQAEVRTRRWVWREGRKSRITGHSRNIFFPIDGFANLNKAEVQQAADELAALLTKHLGATCQTFYLDKNNPAVQWEMHADKHAESKPVSLTIVSNVKRERDAIDELLTRSVADIVGRDELEAKLRSGKQLRIKLGIDPTSPNVHIGRAVTLLKMRQFQDLGHQLVMIIGGFTAQIGDASDKSDTRPMLTPEQVASNMQSYRQQLSLLIDESKVEWHNNLDWFANMPFKEGIILQSYFTVAQMLERDNFADRFQAGKPISLQEMVYPALQGYDSVMIKSDVEIGGTDQLFNMMAGRRLQEIKGQPPQAVMTTGMINGLDGRKMSSSWGNYIALTEAAKDQYGKLMRTVDEMIPTYFEYCTRVPEAEIETVKAALAAGENPMTYKKQLARAIVSLYHGEEEAAEAQREFEQVHQAGKLPDEMPTFTPPNGATEMTLQEILVKTGLAASNKEAQRLVSEGGVKINGEKASDAKAKVTLAEGMVIQRGNRHFVKVKLD